MRRAVNKVFGFLFGLIPIVGFAIFGIAIYDVYTNIAGILMACLVVIISMWLGFIIFKRVEIIGPIEFISKLYATPELDSLEPGADSETKRREPEDFVRLISKGESLFKGGSFRIFGDWSGVPYKIYHDLDSAQFDPTSNILVLNFRNGEKIEIFKPQHIFEASTFFKVLDADRVKLTWLHGSNTQNTTAYFLDYQRINNKIETHSNVDWYKPIFDVSLGDPALMIYGRIR